MRKEERQLHSISTTITPNTQLLTHECNGKKKKKWGAEGGLESDWLELNLGSAESHEELEICPLLETNKLTCHSFVGAGKKT